MSTVLSFPKILINFFNLFCLEYDLMWLQSVHSSVKLNWDFVCLSKTKITQWFTPTARNIVTSLLAPKVDWIANEISKSHQAAIVSYVSTYSLVVTCSKECKHTWFCKMKNCNDTKQRQCYLSALARMYLNVVFVLLWMGFWRGAFLFRFDGF